MHYSVFNGKEPPARRLFFVAFIGGIVVLTFTIKTMRNLLKPSLVVGELPQVDPAWLVEQLPDTTVFLYDLDRTLIGHHDEHFSSEALGFMAAIALHRKQGFISNAGESRTPRAERLAEEASSYIGKELQIVTSAMVNSRKPGRQIFEAAIDQFGIDRHATAYFGDQLSKDVLGSNRADLGASVLVAPYATGDNLAVKYLQRPVERAVRPFVGVPLLVKNFGQPVTIPLREHYPVAVAEEAA